jgi:hypothetical protein
MQYFIKKWVHNIETNNNPCYVMIKSHKTKIFEQLNHVIYTQDASFPPTNIFQPKNSDKF